MTTSTLPRITARVDSSTQLLLQEAAALSGISSINAFVVNAAVEKARQIIDRKTHLKLTERDARLLVECLDAQGKPDKRLQHAAQRYRKLTE